MRPSSHGVVAALTVLACGAALAWTQASFSGLHDGDSYFHSRAAQQLLEHGIQKQFPQTVYSTWRERYSDKDFLFHVLLVPFAADETQLIPRGKIAATVFGSAVLASMAVFLVRRNLRFTPVWILLFLSSHPWLVLHMLPLRPHLLAMTLFPLELLFLLEGRSILLALTCAAHVLGHSSFIVLPGLPLAQGLARVVRGQPLPLRNLAAVLVGCGTASLLHPYFPNNLEVAVQIAEIVRTMWATGAEIPRELFGPELMPMHLPMLLEASAVWLPAALGLYACAWGRRTRASETTLTLATVALGFLVLSFGSVRFFAFFALVSSLLAASAWTDLVEDRPLAELWRSAPLRCAIFAVAVVVFLAVGQSRAGPWRMMRVVERIPRPTLYQPAVAFLDSVARPEDLVYHEFWRPFSWLYYFRPNGRYIEALDPIFFYRADPERFRSMLATSRGEVSDVYEVVAKEFGARWVVVSFHMNSARFLARYRVPL
jgi:hypothetical protein